MSTAYDFAMARDVEGYLDNERSQAQRATRSRANRRLWCFAGVCLLFFAVMDFRFVFDQQARTIACATFGVFVLWQLGVWARHRNQQTSRKDVAAHVEEQSGRETVVLTTAADAHVRASLSQNDVGQPMLDRLDRHASDLAEHIPTQLARGTFRWFVALVIVAVAFSMFGANGGMLSYRRILMPWMHLPYTQVELNGPSDKVATLTAFQLTGRLRGRAADDAQLHNSFNDQVIPVALSSNGSFTIDLPGLLEDGSFWVTAGDGVSETIHIRTFTHAEISGYEIEVTPPEYAARLAAKVEQPNFEVLRGSEVDYRVRFGHPIDTVHLVPSPDGQSVDDPAPIRMARTSDPLVYQVKLTNLSRDLTYRLEITDQLGDITRNDEPFRINVLEDGAPKLRITGHDAKRVLKKGDEDVRVRVKASDDVGLAEIKLVYRKAGTPGESIDVPVNEKKPFEFTTMSLIKLAPFELEPLDVVAVHAEGTDGNVIDGPGIGKSQVVVFEVPEPPKEQPPGQDSNGGSSNVVNPLEMQKYILDETSRLAGTESQRVFDDIQGEQDEANKFIEMMLSGVQSQVDDNPRARGMSAQLELALSTMRLSSRQLGKSRRGQSVLAQEFAVATLTEAAKMMGGDT